MRWRLLFFCLICSCYSGLAQTTLHFIVADADQKVWKEHSRYQRNHADSASAIQEASRVVELLRKKTYLAASADQMHYHHDSLLIWLSIGHAYTIRLSKGNAPDEILRDAGYRTRGNASSLLSYQQWVHLSERMLGSAENRGYPFASVQLDSIQAESGQMRASISFQRGPVIVFDSLLLSGNARVKARFLATYLNILPKQLYSQQKLPQANRLLTQLPYLQLRQPATVRFFEEKAYVKIDVDSRKTNQFDGIIGFLPNQEASNQLLITGDVKLKLNNLFGMGRGIHFQWQQIRPASPLLYLEYTHPILFGTRLELRANFDLLKQDTSFLNVNRRFTLGYPLGGAGKLSATVGLRTSSLSNSAQYKNETGLPASSDVNYLSYGLSFERNTLDDYFYPRRGFRLLLQAEVGNKKIIKNPFLDQQVYEGLTLNTIQTSVRAAAQQYYSLSSKSVLLLRIQAAHLANPYLFYNDLYRLGGLNSLRGFNENTFFASTYTVGTVEYHFFTDDTSYLLLCYDQAWLSAQTVQGKQQDTPLGLGAGISFSTRAGAFNLIYSMGKSANQEFGLTYSKIHLGFVSIF
jgi:outer membrane protein assembly factor BamA